MLMLHVARGYSLRETVARAKLANRADISHVALLKRLRNSDEWLRLLCMELLNGGFSYCIGLPSLGCDFFEGWAHVCPQQRRVIEPSAGGSARTEFLRMPSTAQSLGLSMFGN